MLARSLIQHITKLPVIAGSLARNRMFSIHSFVQQDAAAAAPDMANLVYTEDHRQDGYVILKLNKPPVNSLSLEFLTALNIQLDKIEESKDYNGVIITSNSDNVFCAGLDINEFYQAKPERLRQFWTALQDFWITLYGSNKIYIAAINGHAPAAGCMIAASCDYRIMSKGSYKIGLNETRLGIVAPFWFRDTVINTIGYRQAELIFQLGSLFTPNEALAMKLVDEIAEPKDLMKRAEQNMEEWLKIPTIARELTKAAMRRETITKLLSRRESDTEEIVENIGKEWVQKSLKGYLDALKKKK